MCFINDLLVWFILVLIAPSSPEQVGRWVTCTSTSEGCRFPPRMVIKMLLNECFRYETDVWVTERRCYELRRNGRRSHDNWVAALMSVRTKGEKFHQRRARVRSRSDFAGDFWIRFLPFMFAWRLKRSLVVKVCLLVSLFLKVLCETGSSDWLSGYGWSESPLSLCRNMQNVRCSDSELSH